MKSKKHIPRKLHPLQEHYHRAVALWGSGRDVTLELLRDMLGVTAYGASCLIVMLYFGAYCKELEKIYDREDAGGLHDENGEPYRLVEFIEDMPPYKRRGIYTDELSDDDKERYVDLGVARWMSHDEYRQMQIYCYVTCSRILKAWRRRVREAIHTHDREFLREKFPGKDAAAIGLAMRKEKFRRQEIDAVLDLLS